MFLFQEKKKWNFGEKKNQLHTASLDRSCFSKKAGENFITAKVNWQRIWLRQRHPSEHYVSHFLSSDIYLPLGRALRQRSRKTESSLQTGANVNAKTMFFILGSAEDAWNQTEWVHRHIWQAKHGKNPEKRKHPVLYFTCFSQAPCRCRPPKNGKRLIAVSLCKAE